MGQFDEEKKNTQQAKSLAQVVFPRRLILCPVHTRLSPTIPSNPLILRRFGNLIKMNMFVAVENNFQ